MAEPTFTVTEVAQFSQPTDEMPDAIRSMFAAGAFTVYRYATDDDRVAWVPLSSQAADGVDSIEAHVEELALKALTDLDT